MPDKTCNPSGMGWEQFTAEGSEEAQLRVWAALSIGKSSKPWRKWVSWPRG